MSTINFYFFTILFSTCPCGQVDQLAEEQNLLVTDERTSVTLLWKYRLTPASGKEKLPAISYEKPIYY